MKKQFCNYAIVLALCLAAATIFIIVHEHKEFYRWETVTVDGAGEFQLEVPTYIKTIQEVQGFLEGQSSVAFSDDSLEVFSISAHPAYLSMLKSVFDELRGNQDPRVRTVDSPYGHWDFCYTDDGDDDLYNVNVALSRSGDYTLVFMGSTLLSEQDSIRIIKSIRSIP
jgi:hypothetical protein